MLRPLSILNAKINEFEHVAIDHETYCDYSKHYYYKIIKILRFQHRA